MAEKLHMTVSELQERMTPEELTLWGLYLEHRQEQEEKARVKAARRR